MTIDSSGTKNYGSFIIELSQALPKDIIPSVENLIVHLEGEVRYTLNIYIYTVYSLIQCVMQC